MSYDLLFEVIGSRLILGFSAADSDQRYNVWADDTTYANGHPGLRSYHSYHGRKTLWDQFAVTQLANDPFSASRLWERQWTCDECAYMIEPNISNTHEQKIAILRDLRRELAEKPVRPNNFSKFTDYDLYIENLRMDGRFEDLFEFEENDPGEAYSVALQRLAALARRFHFTLGDNLS